MGGRGGRRTDDDRKRGRMCSHGGRKRAREFRDQAFCGATAREGRESALQTAHSTAFSVISDSARRRPIFWKNPLSLHGGFPSVEKPPVQRGGLLQPNRKRAGWKGRAPARVNDGLMAHVRKTLKTAKAPFRGFRYVTCASFVPSPRTTGQRERARIVLGGA